MTTFTKKVTITYGTAEEQRSVPENLFSSARDDKIVELKEAGKTNGAVGIKPDNVSVLKFVDQASAQEFLDFVLEEAATHKVTIVSSSVSDI